MQPVLPRLGSNLRTTEVGSKYCSALGEGPEGGGASLATGEGSVSGAACGIEKQVYIIHTKMDVHTRIHTAEFAHSSFKF